MGRIYLRDVTPTRQIPGTTEDTLMSYFETRLHKSVSYLIPPIVIAWRESYAAKVLHFVVNPWLREIDWRISAPIAGRLYTVCGDHVDGSEVPWFAMPMELPKGYKGAPASPDPSKRICMECMRWLEQTVCSLKGLKPFLVGRVKTGSVQKQRRWKDVIDESDSIQTVLQRVRAQTAEPSLEEGVPPVAGDSPDLQNQSNVEVLDDDQPDPEQPDRAVG